MLSVFIIMAYKIMKKNENVYALMKIIIIFVADFLFT